MIDKLQKRPGGEQSEDTGVRTRAQRNYLFLPGGLSIGLEKAIDEVIDRGGSDIGSCIITSSVSSGDSRRGVHRTRRIPLLMIGNLLVPGPEAVRALAKGSSRYPSSTALRRETLASLSVPCTTLSLAEAPWPWSLEVPVPAPPRPLRRPRPPPRRSVFRLGIWGADIEREEDKERTLRACGGRGGVCRAASYHDCR